MRRLAVRFARRFAGSITHFDVPVPAVALTFDDGPNPQSTPKILDVLARFDARATFFVIGEAAEKWPELIRRIAQAGHVVGNHSWNHPKFTDISRYQRRRQIRLCQQAIAPYGKRLFRPPWGRQNTALTLETTWLGYKVITWSLDAGDWCDPDAEHIKDRLINGMRPGSVVLLHDAIFYDPESHDGSEIPFLNREPLVNALERFFEKAANHYRFVTIPQMFRIGSPVRR